jgi:hypothetical protein
MLFLTNIYKNSSNSKYHNGNKITFNVPNGFSLNTFDYDLNLFENEETEFYYNNYDGVKLFYWDNNLFDKMDYDEIQEYLKTTVVWKQNEPINICYNFDKAEIIASKINDKMIEKKSILTLKRKGKNNQILNKKQK